MTDDTVTVPETKAAPKPPEKRTVEFWAEKAGIYPQFFGGDHRPAVNAVPQAGDRVSVMNLGSALAAVRPRTNPDYWQFAAAKAFHGWPEGAEMNEAEFAAAVKAAITHPMGAGGGAANE